MSKITKWILILILLVSLRLSSLSMLPASGQEMPTTAVPQFTAKYVVITYYVSPTYTINPYTGQNETTSLGGQQENQTIQFTIQNQPFISYIQSNGIHIFYDFRFKGHFGTTWNYYPSWVNNSIYPNAVSAPYYTASSSNVTVISINLNDLGIGILPAGSQVDFQVQAMMGDLEQIEINQFPPALYYYIFNGQTSDWSNTQTVTIGQSSTSPTTAVPELSWLVIVPLLLSVFSVAVIFRHRKTANLKLGPHHLKKIS